MEMSEALNDLGFVVSESNEPETLADNPSYEFTVDWGDGTTSEFKSFTETPDAWYHTYETVGIYQVSINGFFSEIYSNYTSNNYLIVDGNYVYDTDGNIIDGNQNYNWIHSLTKVLAWGNTHFTNLSMAFAHCQRLTSIPVADTTNSFSEVTTFASAFTACGISEIPYNTNTESGLFDNCPKCTSFSGTFYRCTSLNGSIPTKLISNCPNVTNIDSLFQECSNLSGEIPFSMLDDLPNLKTCCGTFRYCYKLTGSIPSTLFSSCPNITNCSFMFDNCIRLTGTIPSNLFINTPHITKMDKMFYGCSGLTGVESGLFNGLEESTFSAGLMFGLCTNIQSIPDNLFVPLEGKDVHLFGMFYGCNGIKSVPSDILFQLRPLSGNVKSIFTKCTGITTNVETVQYNDIDEMSKFYGAFGGCTNIENKSEIPIELGGDEARQFPEYNIGKIVLEDKTTLVERRKYTYNEQNKPIGIIIYDDGSIMHMMALNFLGKTLCRNNLVANNSISNWNTYPEGSSNFWSYGGKEYTTELLLKQWFIDSKDDYPLLKAIEELRNGNSPGEWYLPFMQDIDDFVFNEGVFVEIPETIIAQGGGYTSSNCYVPSLVRNTAYTSIMTNTNRISQWQRFSNISYGLNGNVGNWLSDRYVPLLNIPKS